MYTDTYPCDFSPSIEIRLRVFMTVAMLALAAAQGQRQMGFLRTTCRAPNPLIQKGGGQSWDKLSIVEVTV